MNKAIIDEVLQLPPQDRLDLMDQIWESLSKAPESIPLPDEHRELLEDQLKSYRANPGNVVVGSRS